MIKYFAIHLCVDLNALNFYFKGQIYSLDVGLEKWT